MTSSSRFTPLFGGTRISDVSFLARTVFVKISIPPSYEPVGIGDDWAH